MSKKRANGEGNLRKRKDGRWEGRYTAGHDPETGKRIRRAARTPEGLQGRAASRMRVSKENFSRAELEKMPRRESEQRPQNEIVHLPNSRWRF